jgi:hypothetical protein
MRDLRNERMEYEAGEYCLSGGTVFVEYPEGSYEEEDALPGMIAARWNACREAWEALIGMDTSDFPMDILDRWAKATKILAHALDTK